MERPDSGAPRAQWMLYVFERVAPILSARDTHFEAAARRDAPVLMAIEALIKGEENEITRLVDPVRCEQVLATLLAEAQAVYDTTAFAGSGDQPLVSAVAAAFSPQRFPVYGPNVSRFWWQHGLEVRSEGGPYFAPEGENYEAAYIQECNRRRLGHGRLEEIWKEVSESRDVVAIQHAAGIGMFQSSPEDSESLEDDQADFEGIMEAAGIGLFQSSVPKPVEP
jgi:hypothetical protein